jgi:hypothetical protein
MSDTRLAAISKPHIVKICVAVCSVSSYLPKYGETAAADIAIAEDSLISLGFSLSLKFWPFKHSFLKLSSGDDRFGVGFCVGFCGGGGGGVGVGVGFGGGVGFGAGFGGSGGFCGCWSITEIPSGFCGCWSITEIPIKEK